MFCSSCGQKADDDARFCKGCGAAVGASTPAQAVAPAAPAAPSATACQRCGAQTVVVQEKDSNPTFFGMLGALLFLFGIGIAFLVHIIAGLIVVVVGLLASTMTRRMVNVLVCPACKTKRRL